MKEEAAVAHEEQAEEEKIREESRRDHSSEHEAKEAPSRAHAEELAPVLSQQEQLPPVCPPPLRLADVAFQESKQRVYEPSNIPPPSQQNDTYYPSSSSPSSPSSPPRSTFLYDLRDTLLSAAIRALLGFEKTIASNPAQKAIIQYLITFTRTYFECASSFRLEP